MTIFSALTLLAVLGNRLGSIGIEKREWDLQTVTASDYTLEIALSDAQVSAIDDEIKADSNTYYYDNSSGIKFKRYMINAIEALIRQEVP